jgi:hypothetical protein
VYLCSLLLIPAIGHLPGYAATSLSGFTVFIADTKAISSALLQGSFFVMIAGSLPAENTQE